MRPPTNIDNLLRIGTGAAPGRVCHLRPSGLRRRKLTDQVNHFGLNGLFVRSPVDYAGGRRTRCLRSVKLMWTGTESVAERESWPKTTPSTRNGHGEPLRKEMRCSECGGILPAGTPISTLVWDRESRRFKHWGSCSTQARPGPEAEQPPAAKSAHKPTLSPSLSSRDPREAPPQEPHPPALSPEGSGEPGPEVGRNWARIGFTLRLAEFESLRVEVALYAVNGEADARFTERLRESLVLKAQEALAAVAEVREWLRNGPDGR